MHEKIIIAGFGGQGILFFGKLLCQAGMSEGEGLCVTFLPSYGAEVRGGTAHCHVVLQTEPIPSPVVKNPSILVVMNEPSLVKFEPRLVSKGFLIINSSLIDEKPKRTDVDIFSIPATDMAINLGDVRVANMVILGALLAHKKIMKKESVIKNLPVLLSSGKESLIDINTRAIEEGYKYVQKGIKL